MCCLEGRSFPANLALQKPSHSSKNKDHVVCIKRRLYLWLDGSLTELIKESRAIQHRLPNSILGSQWNSSAPAARRFAQKNVSRKDEGCSGYSEKQRNGGCFAVA